jgi:hypothetical protein
MSDLWMVVASCCLSCSQGCLARRSTVTPDRLPIEVFGVEEAQPFRAKCEAPRAATRTVLSFAQSIAR